MFLMFAQNINRVFEHVHKVSSRLAIRIESTTGN